MSLRAMALSLTFGDVPPTEFRIFAAGENATSKGTFVFDDQAAEAVMAAYMAHGIDVMLDLEHLSLESPQDSRNFDPDARGWAKLELRNGELWAVNVTWTPDGVQRLTSKTQRYISPAFLFDPDTGRISELLNIAITGNPATHNLEPLVAASNRGRLNATQGDQAMTPEQLAQLAELLGLGADANVEDVLATVAAMVKKVTDAVNGTPPDGGAANDPAVSSEAPPPVVAAASMLAASRVLGRLSGKKDIGEMVREVEAWHRSHVDLEAQRAQLANERATLESAERRRLTGELVKLGAEIPATAWKDDKGTVPAEPWASMPIEQFRDRVAKLAKAKGGTTTTSTTAPRPAAGAGAGAEEGGQIISVNGERVELTASEVRNCRDMNAKLEDYAANKLIRLRAQRKAS